MSLCGTEFQVCCTCVNTGVVNAGRGAVVQGYPIRAQLEKNLVISQSKIEFRLTYEFAVGVLRITTRVLPAAIGNCSPDHNSRCRFSVSRLQFGVALASQHPVITGTKVEPGFIRKHNRSPLRPPVSSGLKPLASQTSMAWSQLNTPYRAPDAGSFQRSNQFLIVRCVTVFCRRRSTMRHSRMPKTVVFPSVVSRVRPEPSLLEEVPHPLTIAPNNHAQ
ncbi:uncharacterized protein TNCV_4808571 [Trichonephila clavipes]|nr:uncharacterized protein TNCV_4808571 [Trichonephila clavipes]